MRPRGDLVHQQPPVAGEEELDADQPDDVELAQHGAGDLASVVGDASPAPAADKPTRRECGWRGRWPSGRRTPPRRWPMRAASIESSHSKSIQPSRIAGAPPSAATRRFGFVGRCERATAPCRRSPRRPSSAPRAGPVRRAPLRAAPPSSPRRTACRECPRRARKPFSRSRSCVVCSTPPDGPHRGEPRRRFGRRDGDVLELERHHVDRAGELGDRVGVVERRRPSADRRRRPPGRRAPGRRRGRGSPAAPPPWRTSGPAARCRARPAWRRGESVRRRSRIAGATGIAMRSVRRLGTLANVVTRNFWPRTSAVCCSWNSCSFSRSSGRVSARIRTASSPAFLAPAAPMASVPTGTPPGICTIDSSESSRSSALLCTGTPSTGSTVSDATMPGRWAAPPAPAMITSSPRPSASVGVLDHPLRRAVGRDDLALVRHAELGERLGRGAHRLPVALAAHDDADEWRD